MLPKKQIRVTSHPGKGSFHCLFYKLIARELTTHKVDWEYRPKPPFNVFHPPKNKTVYCPNCGPVPGKILHKYTPTFILRNTVVIKAFLRLDYFDTSLVESLVAQHPKLDFRMVMQDFNGKKKARHYEYDNDEFLNWALEAKIPACIFPDIPRDWYSHIIHQRKLKLAYKRIQDATYDEGEEDQESDDQGVRGEEGGASILCHGEQEQDLRDYETPES